MSITAYVGLPGHGKSYGVVENVIIPALKDNRVVFTNIPMNTDVCIKKFGSSVIQFETTDLVNNPNWFNEVFKDGALFVIDELWRLWPSGLKANQVSENHKSFLAEHRHLVGSSGHSTEIIFVTQDLSQIAAFARTLVETTFKVNKLTKVGMTNKYRIDIYSGSVTGSNPPVSKREREIFGTFKKDVFDCYVSHTKSSYGAGDEERTDSRFNILKGVTLKVILISLILLFFLVFYLSKRFIETNKFTNSELKNNDVITTQYKEIEKVKTSFEKINVDNVELPNIQSNNIQSNNPPLINSIASNFKDLVSKSSSIIFLGTYINDDIPIHHFKITINNKYSILTSLDLIKLGYLIEPVNSCLVIVSGFKKSHYAMCNDPNSNNNGFVSNLITAVN